MRHTWQRQEALTREPTGSLAFPRLPCKTWNDSRNEWHFQIQADNWKRTSSIFVSVRVTLEAPWWDGKKIKRALISDLDSDHPHQMEDGSYRAQAWAAQELNKFFSRKNDEALWLSYKELELCWLLRYSLACSITLPMIVSISRIRKLRLKEDIWLAKNHCAIKRQDWE